MVLKLLIPKTNKDNFVHSCDTVKDLFKVLYTEIDELRK